MQKKLKIFSLFIVCLVVSLMFISVGKADNANQERLSNFLSTNNVPLMPNAPYGYAFCDTSVTHNGHPSIRVNGWFDSTHNATLGEVDGAWIPVSPNMHVVAGVWVKTGFFNSSNLQAGACFGFDFLGQTDLGHGILGSSANMQASHPDGAERSYGDPNVCGYTINGENGMTQTDGLVCRVPYGKDWTLIQWDFYVPSAYYDYVWTGSYQGVQCSPAQIDYMVFWTGVEDGGTAWFSEPYAYVNPSPDLHTPSPNSSSNSSLTSSSVSSSPYVAPINSGGSNFSDIGWFVGIGALSVVVMLSVLVGLPKLFKKLRF